MILEIKNYLLNVHLGCSPKERMEMQKVLVTIKVRFFHPLNALTSDDLKHTICYRHLCNSMKSVVKNREFNTIENLSFNLQQKLNHVFQENANKLKMNLNTYLMIHKVKPPINNLLGGTKIYLTNRIISK